LRYRYQYLDRIPARLRPADTAGSLVHRVLADFFSKISRDERNAEHLMRLFHAGWEALSPKYLRMKGVEYLRERAVHQLEMFARTADLKAEPLAVEPYFQVEAAPGVTLFGRVDRIDETPDGSLHLIDYKTGADADEVDARQLRLYAIMAEESLGKPVTKLSFWYLDESRISTEDFSDEERRGSRAELLTAIDQMEQTTEFLAKIGRHCGYCPYLNACSERHAIARLREAEGW
jgi:RecB family exonuclease